jgi:mersacidin/lichenicidin family type 2 lantibiotic
MSNDDIIRSWQDPEYRDSLSAEEAGAMPSHPSGLVELNDADLGVVAGGIGISWSFYQCPSLTGSCMLFTFGCCGMSMDHALSDLAVFGGVNALDNDGAIKQEEIDLMHRNLAEWREDPRLTSEELTNITRISESLRGQVSDREWNALQADVREMRETGRISDARLGELTEYVNAISTNP